MQLGYDKKLYILAFDHRGSFQKKFFGIEGEPDPEQTAMIADAKHLIFEGMQQAVAAGADPSISRRAGRRAVRLAPFPSEAREAGLKLAMPAERSGQNMFDFQYGEEFRRAHRELRPRLHEGARPLQPRRRRRGKPRAARQAEARCPTGCTRTSASSCSSCWCRPRPRSCSLSKADSERYDAELRPELMRRAIAEIQDAGIEVDIWKIEGVDERSDCEMLVAQARTGGRDGVVCVVLGRGADDAKVDHWLQAAAPVDGFVGFAIGRSIWWNPLKEYVDGKIERSAGARQIAENYLRFVEVYERAEGRPRSS